MRARNERHLTFVGMKKILSILFSIILFLGRVPAADTDSIPVTITP